MNRSPFELILLGSGTCVPQTDSYASGHIVRFAGKTILLDCGTGILRRMAEAGIDYKTIDAICLTHFHPDHISDLAPFFLAVQYTPGFRRTKPLRIFGPHGLNNFIQLLGDMYGNWLKNPVFPLELQEISRDSFFLTSLQIHSAPVEHSQTAVAYRIETPDGRSITYSGDTDFTPALIELAAGTDLLLLECSFPQSMKMAGHLTPEEAADIAGEAECKKLVLVHLYPVFGRNDPAQTVRNKFKGEVVLGKDLMRFQI